MARVSAKRKAAWEEMMRHSIYEASVSVLMEHGFSGLRMDRVAKAADVSIGTLYNYFEDKEDLVLHVVERQFSVIKNVLSDLLKSDEPAPKKIEAFVRRAIHSFYENEALISVLTNEVTMLRLKFGRGNLENEYSRVAAELISRIIEDGVRRGEVRPCDPLQTAVMLFSAMTGLIKAKGAGLDRSRSLDDDVNHFMGVFFSGLLPQ